jgi:hypothetical protein
MTIMNILNWLFLEPHICGQVHLSTVLKEKVSEISPSMVADPKEWMAAPLQGNGISYKQP